MKYKGSILIAALVVSSFILSFRLTHLASRVESLEEYVKQVERERAREVIHRLQGTTILTNAETFDLNAIGR